MKFLDDFFPAPSSPGPISFTAFLLEVPFFLCDDPLETPPQHQPLQAAIPLLKTE